MEEIQRFDDASVAALAGTIFGIRWLGSHT